MLASPITSVDAILAALAGGLIIGSEVRGLVARVGRRLSLRPSARSFDRVSSADQENGAGALPDDGKVTARAGNLTARGGNHAC